MLLLPLLLLNFSCSSLPSQVPEEDGGTAGSDLAVIMSDPHGPRILSLGTSVNQLTEGESARFVAVITHPDGLDNLPGSHRSRPAE